MSQTPPHPPHPPHPPTAFDALPLALRRVARHAVAAGLTPLIPVPFVDDWALGRVREDLVRSLLSARGLSASPDTVRALAGEKPREGGRLQQWLGKAALVPLRLASRKGYRRLLGALWLKDCVDMASQCLHHGYLVEYALERGDLSASALGTPDAARRLHAAIVAACAELDARPLNQALRRLFAGSRLVRESLAEAWAHFHGAPLPPHPEDAGEREGLGDRLAGVLWEKQGYLKTLESLYTKHLEAREPGPGAH